MQMCVCICIYVYTEQREKEENSASLPPYATCLRLVFISSGEGVRLEDKRVALVMLWAQEHRLGDQSSRVDERAIIFKRGAWNLAPHFSLKD